MGHAGAMRKRVLLGTIGSSVIAAGAVLGLAFASPASHAGGGPGVAATPAADLSADAASPAQAAVDDPTTTSTTVSASPSVAAGGATTTTTMCTSNEDAA